ncbi:MAG: hypothetical protein NC911_05035 [Candidatus Omnitrophica bacterium]|nr:hypothetical protein [Candidatus Omnitrophota bacterium]
MQYLEEIKRSFYRWGIPHPDCGTATIFPSGKVIAGEKGTWKILYQTGLRGMKAGGSLRVRKHLISDWGDLQTQNPRGSGFVEAGCSRGAVKLKVKTWSRNVIDLVNSWPCPGPAGIYYVPWVQVTLIKGFLKPGDTLTLILGQTKWGGEGVSAQTYAESNFNFLVEADCEGTGNFLKVDDVFLEIVGGAAKKLLVQTPSFVRQGQEFTVIIKAEDKYRNISPKYSGKIFLRASNLILPGSIAMTSSNAGIYRTTGIARRCGVFRITAIDKKRGIKGLGNPMVVEKKLRYSLYWGDLHSHSALSFDGRNLPENVLKYARDVAGLDFVSLTEHEQEISPKDLDSYLKANERFHQEGKFVTFFGYEWKGSPVDYNIYYLQDKGPLVTPKLSLKPGWAREKIVLENLRDLKKQGIEAIIVPHGHRTPRLKPTGKGELLADWGYHDGEMEPAAEIWSNQGIFEEWYKRGLSRGYRIAPIGGTDSHHGDPGYSHAGAWYWMVGGLTGVYANSLSRKDLWAAIKARRLYATVSAERIIVWFEINGYPMGSEITISGPARILATVHGTGPIHRVEVEKNGKTAYIHWPGKQSRKSEKPDVRVRVVWSSDRNGGNIRRFMPEEGRLRTNRGSLSLIRPICFDNPREFAEQLNRQCVRWYSLSRGGNVRGVIVDVSQAGDCCLYFAIPAAHVSLTIPLRDVISHRILRWEYQFAELSHLGKLAKLTVEMSLIDEAAFWDTTFTWEDKNKGGTFNYYCLKVIQVDGNMAYSSPIFVNG